MVKKFPSIPRLLITTVVTLLALLGLGAGSALALPEVKIGTGFEVNTASAWTYYSSQDLSSPGWTEDPEIKRLAASLGNDPDRIYAYVRDEVDVIPMFGVKAGARGAHIDHAGTPFDQAQLMVELLRSAGVTASYQLGTITLTGTQFSDWFGVSSGDAARKLLADGGYPATVSGTTSISSVTMMHLWVRATIGGVTYAFDPSFKPHTSVAGIDLTSAMGFNAATLFSNAVQGATTDSTNGTSRTHTLNRSGVRSNLSGYASTLLTHLKQNHATSGIANVVGGRNIIPHAGGALRQTGLSYQASTLQQFTGDIPLVLRTRLTITHGVTTNAFVLDDIYGKQISLEREAINPPPSQGNSRYRLVIGEVPATGWLVGAVNGAAIQINHPYASGVTSGVVNGSYMDRTVNLVGGNSTGMQLFVASGRMSSDFGAYQERVHSGRSGVVQYQKGNEAEPPGDQWSEPQQIALRRRMGATFLSQFWDMTNLVGGVGEGVILVHDVVGVATVANIYDADSISPAASSFMFSMEPAISSISKTGTHTPQALARVVATMTSALEGSVAQQAGDSVYPVSAVAQLDWANAGPASGNRWYYFATPANWNSWARSQILLDYDGRSPVRDIADAYIAAGWNLIIPRSSSLGPGPATRRWCIPWTETGPGSTSIYHDCEVVGPERAGAIVAIHPTTGAIAHLSARDGLYGKGGGGGADIETNPGRVFSVAEDFLDKQFSARSSLFGVDLKSGALSLSPAPDLTIGNGGYPYSLSFQRSYRHQYNSDNDHWEAQHPSDPQPIQDSIARDDLFEATGWTSNLHHYASVSSNGSEVFGDNDPRIAAQTLVTLRALLSLTSDGASHLETLQRQIVGAFVASWWTETIQTNTITIHQGHSSRSFTKLHDGEFVSRGSAEKAELLGARTVYVTPGAGANPHLWWYQHCVRLTGAQRDVSIYGNWNGSTCSAPAPHHRWPTDGNTGDMMFSSQTFPFGVTVTYDRVNKKLSNSLGRWISFSGLATGGNGAVTSSSGGLVSLAATDASGNSGYAPSLSVTDLAGNIWKYVEDIERTWLEVRPPSTPNAYWFRVEYLPGTFGVVGSVEDARKNATIYNLGSSRVSSVVNPLGNATRSWHDRFGNLRKVEDPLGRTSTTAYDELRRKIRETAPEGNAVAYTYDARSNVLTTTVHAKPGATDTPASILKSTATYDTLCNIKLTDTDALSRTTTWSINQTTCQVTQLTQPKPSPTGSNPVTTYSYSAIGKLTQKTDPTGLVTQINYDNLGNPTSVIVDPGTSPHQSITTVFAYDSVGNIVSLTDPRSKVHTGTYDALRRLTTYTGPTSTGVSTTWTYSVDGLITSISRANGANPSVTSYTYWPTGRVKTMTDPDNRVSRYDYDAANRLTYTTDPELRRTLKVYNAASEVIEDRRAIGTPNEQAYASFTYTLNGKQATVKDARNNQTSYTYDGLDRLKITTMPDASYEQLTYDNVDNLLTKRARRGQIITNTYDDLNRLLTHSVPQFVGSPVVTTYSYDLAGRTLTVYDTAGQGLTYGLDSAKRVTSVAQSAPNITGTRTVTYELDKAGNKTRAIWPDSYYVTYQFDDINRMTTVTENGTFVLATYVWDPLSRRASLAYGNGTTQSYSYSKAGDLETHTHTITGNSNTWTNSYTKAHQLLSEAASNAAWVFQPAVNEATSYGSANNLNQYVTVTHAANPMATLYYDGNGNLSDDGAWDFEYDAENRLTKASNATTGTTAQYLYDPMGRRQAKIVGSVTTSFLSDGAEEIAEYDGAGGLLRRYIPGPGTDQPIAMVTPSGGSHLHSYFHTNRQGSTVAMSNDAGTVSEGPYTYDAYGQGAPSTGVPFKYTGRRLDTETGLYYYRARYYSAALGRFLQTDPIGYEDQMNLYGYVNNDPGNFSDPSGEATECNPDGSCPDKVTVIGERRPIRRQQEEQRERAHRASDAMAMGSIAVISRGASFVLPHARGARGIFQALKILEVALEGVTPDSPTDSEKEKLRAAGGEYDRNRLTAAGRSYQKHRQSSGGRLPDPPDQEASTYNEHGRRALDNIIDDSNTVWIRAKGGEWIARSPSGQGAMWRADGSFRGFLD